eukprot:299609-Pelagomonas_calceolata.AAC.3
MSAGLIFGDTDAMLGYVAKVSSSECLHDFRCSGYAVCKLPSGCVARMAACPAILLAHRIEAAGVSVLA